MSRNGSFVEDASYASHFLLLLFYACLELHLLQISFWFVCHILHACPDIVTDVGSTGWKPPPLYINYSATIIEC